MDELRDQLELLGCEDEDWPNEEDEEQEYDESDHHTGEGAGNGNGSGHAGCEDDGLFADDGPDDLTCAICLGQIQPLDLALVKGCEHQYCVHCILQWAMLKEWCPQCKAPFSYLFTHRHLDGTPSDYPLEESVTLLKRARWFVEEHEAREKAKALAATTGVRRSAADDTDDGTTRYHAADADGPPSPRDWCDFYEDMVDAELEEDEAIEDFYYSSAAGRARIVLGNRRWGGGGYMRSGRMYARPVNSGGSSGASGSGASTSAGEVTPTSGKAGKGKAAAATGDASGKGKGKARASSATPRTPLPPAGAPTRPKMPKSVNPLCDVAPALAASPLGRSPGCGSYGSSGTAGSWMAAAGAVLGSSPSTAPGSGRRAKRNARRAAADAAGGGGTPATPARTVVDFTTAE